MVRMRDVLKSAREISRPNRPPAGERGRDELSFPAPTDSPSTPDGERPEDRGGAAADAATEEAATEQARPGGNGYHEAISAIQRVLEAARDGEAFDLEEVEEHSRAFVENLSEGDQLFLQALSARKTITSLAQHSANVSIVAIKVALGLGYGREEAVEVGIAAMVHEVGMTRIPQDILDKRGELSASEYETIKQHPILGRKVLQPLADEYPFLPDVVSQEHERWSGNGYPFGLSGDDIHEYAQIIGLADTFVALTHVRHYRDNFIAYKAIQSIIERRNVDFSARMIKALIDVISIFPVHSVVKLNNGSIARVVQTNKQFPVRPIIEVVTDSSGDEVSPPKRIDLSNEPMIYIVSPVLDESAYM